MDAQDLLAAEALSRVERCQAGLARPALRGARDIAVVTVLADLDPEQFLRGTFEFARRIPAELGDPWYRAFTKTLFFAGNPRHLADSLPYDHVTTDGAIAWLGPCGRKQYRGLSRLLRLFRGPGPIPGPPATLTLTMPGGPPSGRTATLLIATAEVSAAEYLIHVNHILCEATLCGLIGAGDQMRVRHLDELDPDELLPELDGDRHLRIAKDNRHRESQRLRLYACVTAEEKTPKGGP
jgi:hypothetical protein